MKNILYILLLSVALFGAEISRSQDIITTVPNATSCANKFVIIPVIVENIETVSSITLHLDYNQLNGTPAPGVLTFVGFQNMHPALNNGMVVSNSGNTVIMSWWASNYIYIAHDTLLELKFYYYGGSTDLSWVTGGVSKYWGYGCGTLTSTFIDGSVTQTGPPPTVLTHPHDSTVYTSEDCSFTVTAMSAVNYNWKLSLNGGVTWINLVDSGPYSGTKSNELLISDISLNMDGNLYRCYVTGACGPYQYSNPALLNVITLVKATVESTSSCGGEIIVPVNIQDFLDVSEFSLELNYDNSVLSYDSYLNANAALSSGVLSVSQTPGQINISWISSISSTIMDETLIEFKFNSIIGDTNDVLTWNTAAPGVCKFLDTLNNEYASAYTDGNVGVVVCSNITGKIFYDNILATDLANVRVFLNRNGIVADSAITNAAGNYLFSRVHNDTYIISASRQGIWEGANSADALAIMYHFVGIDTLSGLQLLAAEVDSSGVVNTTDALAVQMRFVGLINSFSCGDMVFEQSTVTLSDTTTVIIDLCGLFCGDVNASYIPYPFNFFVPSGILPKKDNRYKILDARQ